MMERTVNHIIQQKVFDIHSRRKEKYAILQSRFSRLFHNDLFPMLEMYIDQEIPAHFNARIDTMTVDLGTVSYDNLEQEIIAIFIESFKKALHEITGNIPVATAPISTKETMTDSPDKHLEVMAFFLVNGVLPWWASPDKYGDVLKITDELLTNKKNDFKELLYRIGANETVRKRLSYQFPKPYIQAVISLLEPDKAPFIFLYHNEVGALQAEEQFVQVESKEFEKALWLFVLDYLLVDRGSIFEERSFVRSSIYKMAMFFNVDYEQLLIAFYEAVQRVGPTLKRTGELGLLIEYVYNDHFGQHHQNEYEEPAQAGDDHNEEMVLLHKLRSIQHYLENGHFLFEPAVITKEIAVAWLHELFDKFPSIFNQIFTDALQHTERHQRLFELLDQPLLKKVMQLLAAGHGADINRYWEMLQLLYSENAAINSSMHSSTFMYQSAVLSLWHSCKGNFQFTTFIKEHLLALSGYYSVDHKKIARVLLQAIIQQQNKSSRHDPLVAGLTALLQQDEKEALLMASHFDSLLQQRRKHDVATGMEALKFLFYYGFLPWWAGAGSEKNALQYVDDLLAADAGKAYRLMQFMLSDATMRRRLISEFSDTQLIDLFKKMPGMARAISGYEALLQLLQHNAVSKLMADKDVRTLLLLALLEGYSSVGRAFPLQMLILHVVQQIAGILHTEPFFIINSLNRTAHIQNAGYSAELKEALLTVKNALYNASVETAALYVARDLLNNDNELTKYISEQLQQLFATKNAAVWSKHELQGLINELSGFSHVRGWWPPVVNGLPHWLMQAVASEMTVPVNVIEVIQLYASSYLKEANIETAAAALLKKMLNATGPGDVQLGISNNEFPALLKELMLMVYRKNAADIRLLLKTLAITAPQFNLLYLLFGKAATPEERSIFYLIKTAAEEKLVELLKGDGPLKNTGPSRLRESISMLIKQNNGLFIQLLNAKEYGHWLVQLSSPWVSDEDIDTLLETLQLPSVTSIASFIQEFRLLLRQTQLFLVDKEAVLNTYRQFLLAFIAGNTSASDLIAFIKAYFDHGEQRNPALMLKFYLSFANLVRQVNVNDSVLRGIIPQLKQELEQRINSIQRQTATTLPVSKKTPMSRGRGSNDAALLMQIKNELKQKKLAADETLQKSNYPALKEPEVEKVYVDNAGLVLLYPFLGTYFSRLGLIEKGKFIDAAAQQRAIHLLAFITDGKEEHAEHSLPLNKILCGLPLSEPVDHAFSITSAERELSIQMLQVIFQRWDKLKNSSIEGFRDAFLKRHGMLTRSEEGWNLRVDQRGYDILLDTIPWGFRFIKSSWMDVILTVEWM